MDVGPEKLARQWLREEVTRVELPLDVVERQRASLDVVADLEETHIEVARAGRGHRVVGGEDRAEVVAIQGNWTVTLLVGAEHEGPNLTHELVEPRGFISSETCRYELCIMRRASRNGLQLRFPAYKASKKEEAEARCGLLGGLVTRCKISIHKSNSTISNNTFRVRRFADNSNEGLKVGEICSNSATLFGINQLTRSMYVEVAKYLRKANCC